MLIESLLAEQIHHGYWWVYL